MCVSNTYSYKGKMTTYKRADNNFMDIKLIRDCDLKENDEIHDLYI